MKYNVSKYMLLAGMACLSLASCIKDDVDDTTTQGNTFVKVLESPENQLFLSPFSTIKKIELFSVRKDANSTARLQEGATVKLKATPELVAAYNGAHGTSYEILPDSLFTWHESNPKVGAQFEVKFQAGQFAHEFAINLNGKKWDLSKRYALGFTVTDGGTYTLTTGKLDILALLSIKNKYEGIYEVRGAALRAGDPVLSGPVGPMERAFGTAGPTSIQWEGQVPWANGGGSALPGGYEPKITLDEATNKLTISSPAGIIADPAYDQHYDPATKTFYIQFTWGAGPASRLHTDTLIYKRPK